MSKSPILIVSPIPSHPQNQGNSARIYRLGRMFQLQGYPVHFLYFGLEGLNLEQAKAHQACWDRFYYIQPDGPAPSPSLNEYYHVDDWFDDRITLTAEKLCDQFDYAACLTNYVWCSKHLEILPKEIFKIIDTHDVFGDRHIVAKAAGLDPVWFYTSTELETMALHRANLIIAIQDEEENYFRSLTNTDVLTVGYVIPEHPLPQRIRLDNEKIKVGYLGSGNPFNVESIRQFQHQVLANSEILDNFEFHLAGTICKEFKEDNAIFNNWGLVGDVGDFYQEMDSLINPMIGGTGLKIKSVEVLSYGKPLYATWDAMVGIIDKNSTCIHTELDSLLNAISTTSNYIDNGIISKYNDRQLRNFDNLVAKIEEHRAAC